ncbi:MAG: crossover junction endodeoxyribonuclease RuvC [Bacteroidia bacterium]|nr:crossover junction endodeoxyribonuclease RuvC [Bacteroidia bacterium]MCF8427207.1 crossover junction endodeoxyribonuclease RuvC [Bacteroidia bacterium]MCF8446405.1 crossover junction endodeoxyribonuclease RuvC [Bacteroidia bacterium]
MVIKERVILGIDPGTTVMGYGVLHTTGKKAVVLTLGVLKLDKYDDYAMKLKKIFERTVGLIDEYHPDELAIEAPFFGKNVQSMLKLGRAQGVAIAAAMSRELSVVEYAPKKIKQSITGNGNASKEQVASLLQKQLKFEYDNQYFDATDGLAAAYCHFMQNTLLASIPASTTKSKIPAKKKASTWEAFVAQNPSKLKKL